MGDGEETCVERRLGAMSMPGRADIVERPGGGTAWALWAAVRKAKPLIQCITNYVSMDFMANTLLAIGASPAMVHCAEEVEDFQRIADALLINVATLSSTWIDGMRAAAAAAQSLSKPWVLDPVGCGATSYRTQTILSLLDLKPTVVRGNASEILALAGADGTVRGVDSTAKPDDALVAAKRLARERQCIVAISGAEDLVTDGERVLIVTNGVPLLTSITAAGCSVTAIIAAFVACKPENPLLATASALAVFGLAAEEAVRESVGPASLRVHLIDQLYRLDDTTVITGVVIEQTGHP